MVAQFLLVRELMVVSLGNELTVGLVFFAWLLWVGVGSAAGGLFVRKRRLGSATVGTLLIALGALLPLSVAWARAQGPIFGYMHGELVPVDTVLLMALAALAPVCLIAGFLFPILCKNAETAPSPGVAGRIYAWDTFGAVIGGLGFSLILVNIASPMACASAAAAIAAAVGASWFAHRKRLAIWLLIVVGIAAAPYWLPRAENVSRTLAWVRPVVESVESGYGNITVLKDGGQYSFFTSGRLAGTVPDPVSGEYMADVPLLAHPAPKTAFFAGVGPTTIREALKHGLKKIVWAELDPKLIELRKKHTPAGLKSVYTDPRVKIVGIDPRRYLATTRERFDVIVINAGSPDTIALNRYFTREAFNNYQLCLNYGGIFALTVPFTENYMNAAESALLGSIILSYGEFRYKEYIPLYKTFEPQFIIGPKPMLIFSNPDISSITDNGEKNSSKLSQTTPGMAADHYRARGIRSEHFDAALAAYYFDLGRTEAALMQFSDNPIEYLKEKNKIGYALDRLVRRPGATINRDMEPIAVFHHMRFASSYYRNSRTSRLLDLAQASVKRKHFNCLLLLLGVVSLMILIWSRSRMSGRTAAFLTMAFIGSAGMIISLSLIVIFQSFYGVVYQYIGVLTASSLAGNALGAALANRLAVRTKNGVPTTPALPALLLVIASFFMCFAISVPHNYMIVTIPLAMAAAGACVGAVFPLAVSYFKSGTDEAGAGGFLYFADLLGAGAGALLAGILMIPLFGIRGTIFFATFISLCAAIATAAGRKK